MSGLRTFGLALLALLGWLVLIALVLVGLAKFVSAQEPCAAGAWGCGHQTMHSSYRTWTVGGHGCCGGQDCRPGRARQTWSGDWQVYIPEFHQWVAVPPSHVDVPNKFRDERNHFCTADPVNWLRAGNPWVTLPVYCLSPAEQRS